MTAIQSITSGQKKQYLRFVEDAADRALAEVDLDKDGIQKLIERGDEFQSRIIAGIRELSVSNEFADEEIASSHGYLSGYSKPRTIAQQVNTLSGIFSGIPIGFAELEIASGELPEGAEGWFAIPRPEKIAPTYNEAVEKVLEMLKLKQAARNDNFYNCREGELGPNHLRQHERTVAMWKKLGDQQSGHDILVVPAQFGLRHRGRSVRRAREVFVANEFGLGAYEVGIMLLTHPERLADYDDLWIDCPGDEYAPVADGRFDLAPCFVYDGGAGFDAYGLGIADDGNYGSASAFLPQ